MSLALLIFLSYSIVAINTRALAIRHYVLAGISGAAFMIVNYFLIQSIAEAKSTSELVYYTVGGVAGDMFGIYLTGYLEKWLGKTTV